MNVLVNLCARTLLPGKDSPVFFFPLASTIWSASTSLETTSKMQLAEYLNDRLNLVSGPCQVIEIHSQSACEYTAVSCHSWTVERLYMLYMCNKIAPYYGILFCQLIGLNIFSNIDLKTTYCIELD